MTETLYCSTQTCVPRKRARNRIEIEITIIITNKNTSPLYIKRDLPLSSPATPLPNGVAHPFPASAFSPKTCHKTPPGSPTSAPRRGRARDRRRHRRFSSRVFRQSLSRHDLRSPLGIPRSHIPRLLGLQKLPRANTRRDRICADKKGWWRNSL